ncbi:hypothetical protein NKG05_18600 [Oerskovia sp. M15]
MLDEIQDPEDRDAARERLAPLVDASTDHVLRLLDDDTALPPPSSDYWEVHPTELTLGTVAPLLAGLEAARSFYEDGERWDRAADAGRAALRLRTAIEDRFGSQGYPRHVSGGPQDAATTFALPPFQPTALAGAEEAWRSSVMSMLRPAGGVAPGAAGGPTASRGRPRPPCSRSPAPRSARRRPRRAGWTGSTRTGLPPGDPGEGPRGRVPAAVAPLTWSSALVVLTLVEMEDQRAAAAAAETTEP